MRLMSEPPRAALVTGSTSGIGLAIALRLARSGYRVTLNYANDDNRATAALSLCREADPGTRLVKADIGTADGAAALVRQAVEASGRLDVLVDNAARLIDKPALEMTEEDWDRVMDVNLKGAFLCSQHAAQQMLTQDDGGSHSEHRCIDRHQGPAQRGQHLRVQGRPDDHDPVPGP
jgi:glucose 1-dehydrogenase